MNFTVYILYSDSIDKYYVGSTGNLDDRISRHNAGRSKYTKRGVPWVLKYTHSYQSRSEAYQAEMYIKSQKSRKYIESLISTYIP